MTVKNRVTFGELLKQYRGAAGLTQEQLAEQARLSARAISDLERGVKHMPRPTTVQLLIKALGLTDIQRQALIAAARQIDYPVRPTSTGVAIAPFRFRTPFVGRATESAQLHTALAAAASRAQALFIGGEPGIGKTRLCHEFINGTVASGYAVLYGPCYSEEQSWPYAPVIRALADYFKRRDSENLRADLRGCHEIARLLPELASRLPEMRLESPLPLDQERRLLHQAIGTFLGHISVDRPAILLLDDLHWAGEATLALVRDLLVDRQDLSLLILATYRDGEVGAIHPLATLMTGLEQRGSAARLLLGPLDSAEARTLGQLLAGHGTPPSDDLLRRAGGNPLLTEGLVADLAAHGQTAEDAIGSVAASQIVAESIRQRAAALPAESRAVLQIAAVVGTVMPFGLVQRAANLDDDTAVAALDAAQRAQLLRETSDGYTFQHDLIRDTLYADLGRERREVLHGRVGEAFANDPIKRPGYAETIAYHFSRSPRHVTRAIDALIQAGDEAARLYANDEAMRHFQQAIKLLERLPASMTKDAQVRVAYTNLADVESNQGASEAAIIALKIALTHAHEPDDRAGLLRRLGSLAAQRGDDAWSHFVAAETLLATQPRGAEWARLRIAMAHVLIDRGRYTQAIPMLEESLSLVQAGSPSTYAMGDLAAAFNALGRALYTNSELPDATRRAMDYWRQALVLWQASNNADGLARAHNNLGLGHHRLAEWDEALAHLQQVEEISTRSGNRLFHAVAQNNQAECLLALGRWQEARVLSERGLHEAEHGGYVGAMADGYVHTALICLAIGDLAHAEHCLTRSLSLVERLDSSTHQWITLRALGQVAEARGQIEEAEGYYRASLAAGESDGPRCMGRSLIALARIARLRGDEEEARAMHLEVRSMLQDQLGEWAGLLRAALALEEGLSLVEDGRLHLAEVSLLTAIALANGVQSEPADAATIRTHALIARSVLALRQAAEGGNDTALLIVKAREQIGVAQELAKESGQFASILSAKLAQVQYLAATGDWHTAHDLIQLVQRLARANGYTPWCHWADSIAAAITLQEEHPAITTLR